MKATLLLFALLTALALDQNIRNGDDVLRAMHERYPTWYRTITFTQKSTTYKPDGTSTAETWYEASSIPGKLRIDIGSATDSNGYVVVDGKVSIIKDNKVVAARDSVNMLLVLGFDVYRQDPETIIKVVKGEGYDLSKLREDTWEGKPVYVVGAERGDLRSRQFWVEKDTLLFVREIEPARGDPGKLNDVRFTRYEPLDGGWVATGVEVYSDGKKVFSEDYTDIRANVKLAPAVFDPQQFSTTHWEKEAGADR
jgi:hypothetical protein